MARGRHRRHQLRHGARWPLVALLPVSGGVHAEAWSAASIDATALLQRDIRNRTVSMDPVEDPRSLAVSLVSDLMSEEQALESAKAEITTLQQRLREAKSDIRDLREQLGQNPNEDLPEDHLWLHHQFLHPRNASPSNVADEAAVLSAWLEEEGNPLDFHNQSLEILKDAVEQMSIGDDEALVDFFRDFSFFGGSMESGSATVATSGTLHSLGAAAQMLFIAQRVFDEATSDQMTDVRQVCTNLIVLLAKTRDTFRERTRVFSDQLTSVSGQDVIPLMVRQLSAELMTLRPVLKTTLKDVFRIARNVDWGRGHRHLTYLLQMLEPFIVKFATFLVRPLTLVLDDWADLTDIGFCRIMSPMVASSTVLIQGFHPWMSQVALLRSDLLSYQAVQREPLWEEEPDVVNLTEKAGELAEEVLLFTVDLLNWVNGTLGQGMRQRLRCRELGEGQRCATLAWPLALLSAWLLWARV